MIRRLGAGPDIVTGHDFRSYSMAIKLALVSGLMAAGARVKDVGLALSPMAYFAQFALDTPSVAMVTASHNENGWTGVKMGAERPLTFGPDEMSALRDIVLGGDFDLTGGGSYEFVADFRKTYLDDLAEGKKIKRKLKVVAACGNGTAGAFAPELLERIGCEVIPLDAELDHTFPRYNPNPEDMEMLHAIRDKVLETGADVGLGFDGDGDRCGVVDNLGNEIFADKVGVMLARDISALHAGRQFRRRRQVDRPVQDRPGAAGQRRQDRLLEDRPFLHQAPRRRTRRHRRLREVRPFLLQPADRARL